MAQLPAQFNRLLVVAFITFPLLGGTQALMGPYFGAFMHRYQVGPDVVSQVVSAQFTGIALGMLGSIALLKYLPTRAGVVLSVGLFVLGLLGMAFSPSWGVLLLMALLFGMGYGLHTSSINTLMAQYGAVSAPMINLVNATFGVGSALTPLLKDVSPTYGVPFLVAAALGTVALLLGFRVHQQALPPRSKQAVSVPLALLLGAFMLVTFTYVSAEVGPSTWLTSHLSASAFAVQWGPTLYWGSLALGRFVFAPISGRVHPSVLVLFAAAAAFLMVLATQVPGFALAGYALAGFCLAPIYPTTLAWLGEILRERSQVFAPLVSMVGAFGPAVTAPLVGTVVAASGPMAIPGALAVLSGSLLLAVVVAFVASRRLGSRL